MPPVQSAYLLTDERITTQWVLIGLGDAFIYKKLADTPILYCVLYTYNTDLQGMWNVPIIRWKVSSACLDKGFPISKAAT